MLNSLKKTTTEMNTLYVFYTVAQKFALQYFILRLECYLEEDKGTSLNPPLAQPAGLRQQRPSGVSMNKLFWMSLCVCRAGWGGEARARISCYLNVALRHHLQWEW